MCSSDLIVRYIGKSRDAARGRISEMQWKTLAVDLDGTLIRSDMLIETGFTLVQWLMVGPLTALAFHLAAKRGD